MYKVVIADDNPLVLDSLRTSIPWAELGCSVAAVAADGESALALIRSEGADLLITDIRMPGMDGLSLAEALPERGFSCKVVVITGYGELEYAKRALRAGVSDFILKPIDDAELAAAVRRALDTVSADRGRLRSAALELSVRRRGDPSVMDELERRLGFLPRRGFCLRLLPRVQGQALPAEPFAAAFPGRAGERAEVRLVEFRDGEGCSATVFLSAEDETTASELRKECAARLTAYLERADRRGFALGLGVQQVLDRDSGLAASLAGAVAAAQTARFRAAAGGTLFQEELSEDPAALAELGRMLGRLERTSGDEFAANLTRLSSMPAQVGNISAGTVKDLLKGGLLALLFRMESSRPEGHPLPGPDVLCRRIDGAFSWAEALEPFRELSALRDTDPAAAGRSPLVRRAMELIAERYADDLGLESTALECGVSPGHLSRRLKAETGATFSELLNRVRVFQAVRCLSSSTMKIYEAAAKVGFDNPAYFNQVFRRVTGKAPREYLSGS